MEATLRAIAEPRRLEIIRVLGGQELSAGEVAAHFDVTRPAISQHLRVLAAAGLVVMRKQGTRRMYRARPEKLAEVRSYLEEFWSDRLQRLKQTAEAEERNDHET